MTVFDQSVTKTPGQHIKLREISQSQLQMSWDAKRKTSACLSQTELFLVPAFVLFMWSSVLALGSLTVCYLTASVCTAAAWRHALPLSALAKEEPSFSASACRLVPPSGLCATRAAAQRSWWRLNAALSSGLLRRAVKGLCKPEPRRGVAYLPSPPISTVLPTRSPEHFERPFEGLCSTSSLLCGTLLVAVK